MNKISSILKPALFGVIALLTFSCNQAELDKLKADNEGLKSEIGTLQGEASAKDSTISEFFTSFNEIESNLLTIKEKQAGLASKNVQGEVKANVKDQIIADLQAINKLMDENKSKVASLNGKLKKSGIKVKQMEELIANLQKQITDQEAQIAQLTADLANANTALASLNEVYNKSISDGTAKEDELNVAYYTVGAYKELRDKNVIAKSGGVIGIGATKQLKDSFNKDVFTKIDIRKTTSINTGAKQVKLLTTHPSSSYSLTAEAGVMVLTIKDAKSFWSAEKYLVIEQKKK